jgi:hypothetical protein
MKPYHERFQLARLFVLLSVLTWTDSDANGNFITSSKQSSSLAAGCTARVRDVGFYHGGDALYHLEGVPGTWHEACLHAVE